MRRGTTWLRWRKAATKGGEQDQAEARNSGSKLWFDSLPEDHPLKELARRLAPVLQGEDRHATLGLLSGNVADLPPAARKVLLQWMFEVSTDPKKRAAFRSIASDLAMARYRRVTLADLGIDEQTRSRGAKKKLNEGDRQREAVRVLRRARRIRSPRTQGPSTSPTT